MKKAKTLKITVLRIMKLYFDILVLIKGLSLNIEHLWIFLCCKFTLLSIYIYIYIYQLLVKYYLERLGLLDNQKKIQVKT